MNNNHVAGNSLTHLMFYSPLPHHCGWQKSGHVVAFESFLLTLTPLSGQPAFSVFLPPYTIVKGERPWPMVTTTPSGDSRDFLFKLERLACVFTWAEPRSKTAAFRVTT
jgi:hypothetical protein